MQPEEDNANGGVFIYAYAKNYLVNSGKTMDKAFDVSVYRSEMREIIRKEYIRQNR